MMIRPLAISDREEWVRIRCLLWPDAEREDLESELHQYATGSARLAVLVAERDGGGLCGMIELSQRDVADGCTTSPVGYVEGWYVDEDVRRRGVGRALV